MKAKLKITVQNYNGFQVINGEPLPHDYSFPCRWKDGFEIAYKGKWYKANAALYKVN